MPYVSKAQGNLMRAAAHTAGGYGGVPQSVGKNFVAAGPASAKLPEHVKRQARRAAVKAGTEAPRTHHEFHALGDL